jgi:hypothetical protein
MSLEMSAPSALFKVLGNGDSHQASARLWQALGSVHFAAKRYAEAASAYRNVLSIDPTSIDGLVGRGVCHLALGEPAAAITHLEAAVSLEPERPDTHTHLGIAYHLLGNTERGWNEFGHRGRSSSRRYPPERRWDGTALNGRTILLWTDQGRGDTIQCLRYIQLVRAKARRIVVECHHRGLIPLIQRMDGVEQVVPASDTPPPFHVHAPLVFFPAAYPEARTHTVSIVPYLSVDEGLRATWKERVGSAGAIRIGISWAGNDQHPGAISRFVPLSAFERLTRIAGVRLITLQHGPQASELTTTPHTFDVEQLFVVDEFPIVTAAALILNLDLVITVDTMIAHLAGALGKPVWTLLRFESNWRWQMKSERTPWYPTMRLFRQHRRGEWEPVFEEVEQAVRHVVDGTDSLP